MNPLQPRQSQPMRWTTLTLHGLPPKRIFDLTRERCPVDEALREADGNTKH